MQDYRYGGHDQCIKDIVLLILLHLVVHCKWIVSGSEVRIFHIKNFLHVISHETPLMVFGVGTRNLFNSKMF